MFDTLVSEIEMAAANAISDLMSNGERFYYISLVTTGEGLAPNLTAWSTEALEREMVKNNYSPDEVKFLKWSYAESPYYCFGEIYFERVKNIFKSRPQINHEMSETQWNSEFSIRINAMEAAMARLDTKGVFGVGASRCEIVINAEVMPPDTGNTDRAKRLNPKDALASWLVEAAEH